MQINALNVEFQKFQFQTKTASMYTDYVVVERNDSQPPLEWPMRRILRWDLPGGLLTCIIVVTLRLFTVM